MESKISANNQQSFSVHSAERLVYRNHVQDKKRRQLFNEHWRFIYGDQSNAHLNGYDDSTWENIDLPHDYSLTLPYTTSGEAESGYKLGGIGWYRKSFTLDESLKGKRFIIEFGGIYMNATIYINGQTLGHHPYGYTPFAYDLTDYLHFDQENVLAVRVNHKFPSSRWYSGSGIYRNVYLTITDQVCIDHYGIRISAPHLEEQIGKEVDLHIQTKVNNHAQTDADVQIKHQIRKKASEMILSSEQSETVQIKAAESALTKVTLKVEKPDLWSVAHPHLYEIITEVMIDGEVVDTSITDYGFRTIHFDQDTGFYLNGQPLKLKGVCMHHDQGPLGSAAHEKAMERQLDILIHMGANAIRMAHNPAADELINLANQKGLLVIDEAFDTWVKSKNGNYNDYAVWFRKKVGNNPLLGATPDMTWAEFDLKTMVRRGINDPAIIMWSVGNEVMEGNSAPYDEYPSLLAQLVKWVQEEDTSRPTTTGENKLKANWDESIEMANILADSDGLVGFNYASEEHFDGFRKKYPHWKIYGAETASSINSRGVYKPDNYTNHLTSYDESVVGWGHLSAHSWYMTITRDFNAGEFVWTGFDYLGEPTPWNNVGPGATGGWPSPKSSYFGIIDTAGNPKDRYYFYQSQWNEKVNTLHILPIWSKDNISFNEDGKVRVDVYSNARAVELFFVDKNGVEKSLGKKTFTPVTTKAGYKYQIYDGTDKKEEDFRNLYLTWHVAYEDGTVYAKAYDEDGNIIQNTSGRKQITTYQAAHQLKVTIDREEMLANGRDLAYLDIQILDEAGNIVETADNWIHVNVSGEGVLMALDNGNQVDHEPYESGKRQAFNGKLVGIIQSTRNAGEITVQVESDGMDRQTIQIVTVEEAEKQIEKQVVGYILTKNHYVKLGKKPDLPIETTIHFNDRSTEVHPIVWKLEDRMFNQAGIFQVVGKVEAYDLEVFAYVSVIESVGGLLNYSTAVETGVHQVALPATRPLVLENGDILSTEFPVTWDKQDEKDYQKPGIITINGIADVFGEKIPVLASVRVDKAEVTYGNDVAKNYLTLREGHSSLQTSEKLIPLVDQSVYNAGETWTNKERIQAGYKETEIIFTYATAQFLGSLDLFYQNNEEFSLPEKVELYWSNEGTEDAKWTKINDVQANEQEEKDRVKVNYQFPGIPAVAFKIVLTSSTSETGLRPIGINKIELRIENTSLRVHEVATLDDLLINGRPVSKEALEKREIHIPEDTIEDIEAISHQNVAATIINHGDSKVHIITESEDQSTRDLYTIHLQS